MSLYGIYELINTVDNLAKNKNGYALGVVPMFVLAIITAIPLLYVVYNTEVIL